MLSSLEGPEGLSVLERPMAFDVIPDESDTWSHGIDRYGEAESRFEGTSEPVVVHRDPLRGQIRTEARWGKSILVQEFILDADSPFLRIRIYLDWRGSHKVLKATFPLRATESAVTAEIPHGAISRPAAILLQSAGVQVQAWLRGPIEQIVEAFVSGQLGNDEHIMPFGRGGPGRQNQGGRGQGRGKGSSQGQGQGRGSSGAQGYGQNRKN